MIVVFDIGNVLVRWDPTQPLSARLLKRRGRAWSASWRPRSAMDFVSHTDAVRGLRRSAVAARARSFPEFAKRTTHCSTSAGSRPLGGPIEENVALHEAPQGRRAPGLRAEQLRHGQVRASPVRCTTS